MTPDPIPAAVYAAARRIYLSMSTDREADDATVRAWARDRRGGKVPADGDTMAFWVMSIAAKDGHL